jgi:hypothetical protein
MLDAEAVESSSCHHASPSRFRIPFRVLFPVLLRYQSLQFAADVVVAAIAAALVATVPRTESFP